MKANIHLSFRCAVFPGRLLTRRFVWAVVLVVIVLIAGPDQREVIQLLLQP